MVAFQKWHVHQMDVKNAFLHGDIDETVHMKMPPGYLSEGYMFKTKAMDTESLSKPSNKVCKLLKTLYGLEHAPRHEFAKLSSALSQYGLQQSRSDYNLFIAHNKHEFADKPTYVVDDLLIIGNSLQAINKAKHLLNSQFKIKDMGELRYFLGIEVDRTSQGIFLS